MIAHPVTMSASHPRADIDASSPAAWPAESFPPISFQEVSKREYESHMGRRKDTDILEADIVTEFRGTFDDQLAQLNGVGEDEPDLPGSTEVEQVKQVVLEGAATKPRRVRSGAGSSPPEGSRAERILPESFSPGPWSVVIGKDKKSLLARGNQRLREIVGLYMEEYAKCRLQKEAKSEIISAIESTIQKRHGTQTPGAFIKYINGRWWEVDRGLVREKISRQLRESLHTRYKSSSKQKRQRRRLSSRSVESRGR